MNKFIDPGLLITFVAIAENGSFQGAAQLIGRTQSTTTMQIQRLETLIGEPLFIREKPKVRLTDKGADLFKYAKKILTLQTEALTVLTQKKETTLIKFGIPDYHAYGLLPQILNEVSRNHSNIELEITCEPSPKLIELIEVGKIDLAIISRQDGAKIGQFLRDEPIVWATSDQHSPHLEQIIPVAVFQEECPIRKNTIFSLKQGNFKYRIAFSSPHVAALIATVKAGFAIASLPISCIPQGFKILNTRDGLPVLSSIEVAIVKTAEKENKQIDSMYESICKITSNYK